MDKQVFVIVGASLAGAKAAETLREEGFNGRIVLIGDEPERPYERPPLSKGYLRGETDSRPYVHEESFYSDREIELRTSTTVERIDPSGSELWLAGGETLHFDRLLLTTGAQPRRLSVSGADLDGVFYLRSVEDSEAIRDRIDQGGRLVTIGAGWIGAEVAASAKQRGCDVAIVEQAKVPLERVLGAELGEFYRDVHTDHGVQFIGGAAVEAIEGETKVAAVRLADGRRVKADFVVVGVGVEPRVQLARAAGLAIDNGIVCDEYLQTSAGNVYAAGDVANAPHPLFGVRLRVEHWANALNQGPAAARSMLGSREPYDRVPYFFSDQYEIGMEYSGYAAEWDEVVVRGGLSDGKFVAFWLKDGRVLAGMAVNMWGLTEDIRGLISSRRQHDRARLVDPDIPLTEISGASPERVGTR